MPKAKAEQPPLFEVDEIAPTPDKVTTDALAVFNEVAGRVNLEAKAIIWRLAKVLTDARRKRLKVAVQDCGGIAGWRKALDDASRNNFLLGKEGRTATHRNWSPDLDFFLQPKTVLKMIEGAYSPSLETPKRLLIPMAYAPRPGQNEKPFVPESQDVRELAMIDSYTRHGRYADANRIAQARADRLGQAAVLIPDPAVAMEGMPAKATVAPKKPPTVTDVPPDWADEPIPESAYHEVEA